MNFLDEDKIKYIKWGLLFFVFFSLMSINCYQVYLLSREEDNNDISMIARDTINNIGKAIKVIRNGN